MAQAGGDGSLNSSIVSLIAFGATILLTLKSPKVRLPFKQIYLHLDYGLTPIVCVAFLLATSAIDVNFVVRGIVGCEKIKPYSIIILILSLAYLCISLDITGLFEYVALHVVRLSRGSGKKLFVYLFMLTSFLTLFTSNDVVILTITPIIIHMCRAVAITPIPFLLAQFFAANISGMGLYVGNPTNIVIAEAYGISFAKFAEWMLLPALSAVVTCLLMLWMVFHKKLPNEIRIPQVNPKLALKDRKGALLGLVTLGCALFFMSLPSAWTGLQPWTIALVSACIMFFHDLLLARPNVLAVLKRMPWKIAPFLIGLFVIVESMASSGWTDLLALQLSKISTNHVTAVLGVGFISSLAAGLMNNHPMTIFFVKTLQSPTFSASQLVKFGSMLALVVGSNLGANFMLTGALAGLMWAKILSNKGYTMSFSEFSKHGFLVMPAVVIASCLTLACMLTFSM
ncbi:MAG: ArsB/NhaD family transporter [Nitrososphaerota archaeon]|nr:SLC13 family permease [Candidatus Bathyarchaeota archaeon]MDW8023010.1 ArsB/NhaD family transporter [Nitrososphaerota archaeon]